MKRSFSSAGWIFGLAAALAATSIATGQDQPPSRDKSAGYWQFVESFRNEYSVEKRNKARLYEIKWAFRQVSTRVGNLVGAGGNIVKDPVAERTTAWTWTTLSPILVPGDRLPVTLAYTVGGSRGDPPRSTMTAGFNRAPPKPAPNDKVDPVNNGLSIAWGIGVKNAKDKGRLDDGIPELNPLEGTIVVPPFGYAESDKTQMVDFAVIVAPGQSFYVATLYRYKWVAGTPPPSDQRGNTVPDPGEDPITGTPPPGVEKTPPPTNGGTPPGNEPATTTKFTIQAGVRRAKPGEVVRVPVYLLNPSGVANVNSTVSYTPAVAAAEGKPIRGNVLGTALFEANAAESGIARVGFAGSKPVTDSGILAHIAFKAVGRPGDRTVLKVAVTTANGVDGGTMTAATIDGEVVIVGEGGKIPGDADGDEVITASDALSALKMSVKLIPEDKDLDMDHDGSVTSNDARLILLKAVGK